MYRFWTVRQCTISQAKKLQYDWRKRYSPTNSIRRVERLVFRPPDNCHPLFKAPLQRCACWREGRLQKGRASLEQGTRQKTRRKWHHLHSWQKYATCWLQNSFPIYNAVVLYSWSNATTKLSHLIFRTLSMHPCDDSISEGKRSNVWEFCKQRYRTYRLLSFCHYISWHWVSVTFQLTQIEQKKRQ